MIGYIGRWLQLFAASGILCALATSASANGRFPRAQYLKEAANNSNELILSATYGLLVTGDRGKNWHLVCERSLFGRLPDATDWIDPLLELTASGGILSGSDRALRVSRDRGCSFVTETALPVDWKWFDPARTSDKGNVIDISLEVAKGDRAAVALVADVNGPATDHQAYESLDDGASWKPLGKLIAGLVTSVTTIDVAPSDSKRIYVTGRSRSPLASLISSEDGGETWAAVPIAGTEDGGGSYIAAIAPTDPSVIYVRTDRWLDDPVTGGLLGEDTLHYSSDGGKTWTEILRKRAKLMGFALSPDGKTVLAGYGDPVEPGGRGVEEMEMGIYRAEVGTWNFQKIFDASVTCLAWNKTGVYACTSQARDGFHLGFAANASFDLGNKNALEPLLKLPEVKGPLPWAAGKSGDLCMTDWVGTPDVPGLCARLGACRDAGLSEPAAPLCGIGDLPEGGAGDGEAGGGAGSAGSGGTGGSPGTDSGRTDAAGMGGAPAGAGGSAGTGGTAGTSCDCRMPRRSATRGGSLSLVALLLIALRRAARR